MGTQYTEYQSVELPPIAQDEDMYPVYPRRRVGGNTRRILFVWIAAFAFLATLALISVSNTSATSTSLYSYVVRLGSSHDKSHSHRHDDDGKDFTKIVIIDKHSRGSGKDKHHPNDDDSDDDDSRNNDDTSSKKNGNSEYDWKKWVPKKKSSQKDHGDKHKHDKEKKKHEGKRKRKHDENTTIHEKDTSTKQAKGKNAKSDDISSDNDYKEKTSKHGSGKSQQKSNDAYDWKKWVPGENKNATNDDDSKKNSANDGTKASKNQTNGAKQETPFSKRSGEIHGFTKVNKSCTDAYNTRLFLDFGQLFYSLLNISATQLSKHTYSFELHGYPSVEYVMYNETAMQLDVVIVQGFDVFKAFHEVIGFKEVDDGKGCRIYRTQYLILADNGPVSWSDIQAAGGEELPSMYKLFSTLDEPSTSNFTGVDESTNEATIASPSSKSEPSLSMPTPAPLQVDLATPIPTIRMTLAPSVLETSASVPATPLPSMSQHPTQVQPTTVPPTTVPTTEPTPVPSTQQSVQPSQTPPITLSPTFSPSIQPTFVPPTTSSPTLMPSHHPSLFPTPVPPTAVPPTSFPTPKPTLPPTNMPTMVSLPTRPPTLSPQTLFPTEKPISPVPLPTQVPTEITPVLPKETSVKEESAGVPERS